MRSLLGFALLCLLAPTGAVASGWVHPFDYPQTDKAPEEFYAVNEIPAGGFTKYEIDAETGHVLVDRFVRMPVAYPANYGSITQSLGGDEDPLDVLIYTREPLHPGVIVKVRPVAILKMLDGGEVDDKVVAVPASKIDPSYDEIRDLGDLPDYDKKRLEAFFRVYKQLKSDDAIEIKGWAGTEEALRRVKKALDNYRSAREE